MFALSFVHGNFVITGGETEDEKIRVDILENQVADLRMSFVRMCYTDFVSINLNGTLCYFASLNPHQR